MFFHFCSDLILDFGSSNLIGCPRELRLVATNSSAVHTRLTMAVEHFHAHQVSTSADVNKRNSNINRYIESVVDLPILFT